jgi:phosphoglycerate dehydrogenase-like enzyme
MKPASPVRVLSVGIFAPGLDAALKISHVITAIENRSDAEVAKLAAESDVVVSGGFKAAWKTPGAVRPLLVSSSGAGYDGIDRTALPAGCAVCNVYGHERGVTEEAFMHILALQRNLRGLDAALRRGDWSNNQPYLPEVRGRRLLILGLGHIGAELLRFGQFFGMEVSAVTRRPSRERAEQLGIKEIGGYADLGRLLPSADFVVVAIPHSAETENLIGEKELKLMKPGAFIVNVGRGPVINEAALYDALRDRRIAGAGLGVWYQYPEADELRRPSTLPFHELENVVMAPHKPTQETIDYRIGAIAKNIERLVAGEPLVNLVYRV